MFLDILFAYYHASVTKSSTFPSILTLADITPVFKKGDKECKSNYRPVSILSDMPKIFEIIFRQISNNTVSFLSKCKCGFQKGYSIQHCLLFMLKR